MEQAERDWAEEPNGCDFSDLTVECPSCGWSYPDADGLPVYYCDHCGYCRHASRTDGTCDYCGRTEAQIEEE